MTLTLSPVVVTGMLLSIDFLQYTPVLAATGITVAFSFLLSQVGRDAGKRKEPNLWKLWGGMPSVVLLRWADNNIDSNTKSRYHAKLHSICPLSFQPDNLIENTDPIRCDEAYTAWSKFILSRTRDQKDFRLLYSENVNYGYRRNLWGLKPFAITLILLCMLSVYGFTSYKQSNLNALTFSTVFYTTEAVLVLFLLFWLFVVRRDWVRITAFAYATRLLETTEKL